MLYPLSHRCIFFESLNIIALFFLFVKPHFLKFFLAYSACGVV